MSNNFKRIKRFLLDKDYRFLVMARYGLMNVLSDRQHIRRMFHARVGVYPELDVPKTFNEKLQWLKMNNRKSEYSLMVDKYEAKIIVADTIGDEYIIPTYKVWKRVEDIDITSLPEQFVLKCTHDCGSIVICRDKNTFDLESTKKYFKRRLKKNTYWHTREWPYKNVRPRIIAEKYMKDRDSNDLRDYKIHCFNGKPMYLQVIGNRNIKQHTANQLFYTFEWNDAGWAFGDYPPYDYELERPKCLEEMKYVAEKLSEGIPYVRIDLYEIDGQVYFGEITFYPLSGFYSYNEYYNYTVDKRLGDMISISV